jgi:iron complex outermembrane receptor protein
MDDRPLRTLIRSITGSLATGLALGAGLPGTVQAAEPAPALTGTQLSTNARAVRVITREDIRRSGHFTLGGLLQDLPWAGPALNPQSNNGGDGTTRLNLRRLGADRVLVLVDGRRWTGLTGTRGVAMVVDLDQFPLAAIERIEILLDGASAAYGADAVAGVVNLITRRSLEGIEARAQRGRFDAGDGAETRYDFSVGVDWSRGRALASASRYEAEPVAATDRNISREPLWGTGIVLGSSSTPNGRFRIPDAGAPFTGAGATRDTGGDFTPSVGDFRPYSTADAFNFVTETWLSTPATRDALHARGELDLATDWTLGIELWHTERDTAQRIASVPLTLGPAVAGARADGVMIGIDATNPFNIFGMDLDPLASAPGLHLNAIQRRMVETGGRRFEQASTTERAGLTLTGSAEHFGREVGWTLAHHWTDSSAVETTRGQLDTRAIATALGPVAACTAPCVPLNLFGGAGSITQSMLDYIGITLLDRSARTTTESAVTARTELYALPAGSLAAAFGVVRREESGHFRQDPQVAAGNTTGNPLPDTQGAYDLVETWAEFAVPISADLDAGLALRRTAWRAAEVPTSVGLTLAWRAHDTLALHASVQRGHRLPGIQDLFLGDTPSFPTIADPCSGVVNSGNDQLIANCTGVVSNGVAPTISGPYVDPSYVQGAPVTATVGGNPLLAPENTDSTRFGLTWRPAWVEGLSFELDHWSLESEGGLATLGATSILQQCYGSSGGSVAGGRQQFCDVISRAAAGDLLDVRIAPVNALRLDAAGVDLRLVWEPGGTALPGVWRVAWDAAWLDEYQQTSYGTPNPFGFPDVFGARPTWRAALAVDWALGSWEAAWRTRFIGRTDEFCSSSYTAIGFPCSDVAQSRNSIGATTYHDVQVSYVIEEWDTRVSFGIRNLGDKQPPLSAQADFNSYYTSTYEVPGRFPYLRIAREFD